MLIFNVVSFVLFLFVEVVRSGVLELPGSKDYKRGEEKCGRLLFASDVLTKDSIMQYARTNPA